MTTGSPNAGVLHRDRMRFERDFTQLPNQWLRDRRLSRAARGLLAELMTHEAGYELSIVSLTTAGPEGRDALRTIVSELEGAGYLHRHRERRKGRLGGTIWRLQDPFDVAPEQPVLAGLERPRSTYVGKSYVGDSYVGPTASENPTTIEDQFKNISSNQAPYVRPVDNLTRHRPGPKGACGHPLVDDRHCFYGCPSEAVSA